MSTSGGAASGSYGLAIAIVRNFHRSRAAATACRAGAPARVTQRRSERWLVIEPCTAEAVAMLVDEKKVSLDAAGGSVRRVTALRPTRRVRGRCATSSAIGAGSRAVS